MMRRNRVRTVLLLQELLSVSDGAIIGSAFKTDGDMKKKMSFQRARDFIKEVEKLR